MTGRTSIFNTLTLKNRKDVLKMETDILNIISHIKNVSKERVTDERIKSELRRKDMLVEERDFEMAVDNLVSSNKLELRGNDSKKCIL